MVWIELLYSEMRVESEDGHKTVPWVTEGVKGSRKACVKSSFSKKNNSERVVRKIRANVVGSRVPRDERALEELKIEDGIKKRASFSSTSTGHRC